MHLLDSGRTRPGGRMDAGSVAGARRLLFVDDDEALVALSQAKLRRAGYAVTGFCDPGAALAAFAVDPGAFDVVVTDVSMAGMDGYELAARLVAIRPGIPVVITSGNVGPEDERRAAEAGARAIVLKWALFRDFAGHLERLGT